WPGDVVRAFNTTRMLDRIAAKHGRKLIECGIGFKYICDLMMDESRQILVGGEESGGIGIQRHLPERDGLLNALLLANVMADEGKSMGQLVAALQNEYGPHFYARRDLQVPNDHKQNAIPRAAANGMERLGPYRIMRKDNLDGIKFYLDTPVQAKGADAWVLLRSSGTEPLMRIYCEASSPDLVQGILNEAVAFVDAKTPAVAKQVDSALHTCSKSDLLQRRGPPLLPTRDRLIAKRPRVQDYNDHGKHPHAEEQANAQMHGRDHRQP